MDTLGDASLEALETRAKLQVKVHRTILRHQLIMVGNALLVAFLFAALLMLLWSALIYAGFGTPLLAGRCMVTVAPSPGRPAMARCPWWRLTTE